MSVGRLLAIIPARGGSKRLPGKNLRLLHGRPLIAWTIQAALDSKRIQRVIVSTDDEKIAEAAREAGAGIPFLRPKELASDTADSVSVVKHAIAALAREGKTWESIALLQPTSPLRTGAQIDEAVALMERAGAAAVISVCKAEHTPLGMNTLPESGSMDGFLSGAVMHKRSQDLPDYYRINGAIYLAAARVVMEESTFFPQRGAFAYVMDRRSSVDIDEEEDLLLAEAVMRLRTERKGEAQ